MVSSLFGNYFELEHWGAAATPTGASLAAALVAPCVAVARTHHGPDHGALCTRAMAALGQLLGHLCSRKAAWREARACGAPAVLRAVLAAHGARLEELAGPDGWDQLCLLRGEVQPGGGGDGDGGGGTYALPCEEDPAGQGGGGGRA